MVKNTKRNADFNIREPHITLIDTFLKECTPLYYTKCHCILMFHSFYYCCLSFPVSLSIIPSLSLYLNPCQVPHPTAPPWRHLVVTCQHPLTSQPLDTSSQSAGLQTMAQTRKASKFAMLVSTKVCIPTLFYYYF